MFAVVAMIAAASLLSLGAFSSTIITPVHAIEGEDEKEDDGTEKNIDELIIINKDNKAITQEELVKHLTDQSTKAHQAETEEMSSTVGASGFSAPSLP